MYDYYNSDDKSNNNNTIEVGDKSDNLNSSDKL